MGTTDVFIATEDQGSLNTDHIVRLYVEEEADYFALIADTVDGNRLYVRHGMGNQDAWDLLAEIVGLANAPEAPIASVTSLREAGALARGPRFGKPVVRT